MLIIQLHTIKFIRVLYKANNSVSYHFLLYTNNYVTKFYKCDIILLRNLIVINLQTKKLEFGYDKNCYL